MKIKETLTVEKLIEILKSKKLEDLIGYAENDFFDVKRDFYNLRNPEDKHEICKDITAFANNEGGCLLIGCDTEKSSASRIEYVKSLDGISDFPNIESISSILSDYIHPNLIVSILKFEQMLATVEGQERKFFLITINKDLKNKPYLVKRDSKDREFFAYYIRTNDRGTKYQVEHLHELIHRGIYFEEYLKSILGTTERILDNTERLIGKTQKTISLGLRYDIKKDL